MGQCVCYCDGDKRMMYIQILQLAAVLLAGYGAFTDFMHHRIYNKQTMPGIAAGILLHIVFGGAGGFLDSLLGFLLGTSFMLVWILGMLKAGDVKLYMSIGALAGWKFCGYTMIYSILLGGAAAAWVMISRKSGRESLKRVRTYLLNLMCTRQFRRYQPEKNSGYFSFGCCIFGGALIAVWRMYVR